MLSQQYYYLNKFSYSKKQFRKTVILQKYQIDDLFILILFNLFQIRNGSDENDVQEDNLKFDIGFGHIIVVPPYKFEKLEGVIRKIYCQIGLTIREDGFWMPVSHVTDKTLGYCFIEYNTPQVTNY